MAAVLGHAPFLVRYDILLLWQRGPGGAWAKAPCQEPQPYQGQGLRQWGSTAVSQLHGKPGPCVGAVAVMDHLATAIV